MQTSKNQHFISSLDFFHKLKCAPPFWHFKKMKLSAAFLFALVAAQDYDEDDYSERKKNKNKNKNLKHDACGCQDKPQNGPDAIATCVEDNGEKKTIDWTCPATGEVKRMTNVRCKKIKRLRLDQGQCGALECKCDPEMDAQIALMNPAAKYECTSNSPIKRPRYRIFCDTNSNDVFDFQSEVNTGEVQIKCRRGMIKKNPFNVNLCD